MKEISKLTSKILAYKELDDFNMSDSIDWAVDMLGIGYESPSLLILAGLSKPTDLYEAEEYLKGSIKELGLKIPERNVAISQYCKYLIEKIADEENVKENLYHLYTVARTVDDDKRIFNFYLLCWAWGELDCGVEYQHYWDDATLKNIEQIVIKEAKKYLISTLD
jgi:hypothetical protein